MAQLSRQGGMHVGWPVFFLCNPFWWVPKGSQGQHRSYFGGAPPQETNRPRVSRWKVTASCILSKLPAGHGHPIPQIWVGQHGDTSKESGFPFGFPLNNKKQVPSHKQPYAHLCINGASQTEFAIACGLVQATSYKTDGCRYVYTVAIAVHPGFQPLCCTGPNLYSCSVGGNMNIAL